MTVKRDVLEAKGKERSRAVQFILGLAIVTRGSRIHVAELNEAFIKKRRKRGLSVELWMWK